jgi:hypothetical protein
MSATKPPAPNGKPWGSDYVSTNGASYITAFALPLLGLFVGIVCVTRPNKATARHGRWIIGISLIASVIWALVFVSGALTSTSNDMGY